MHTPTVPAPSTIYSTAHESTAIGCLVAGITPNPWQRARTFPTDREKNAREIKIIYAFIFRVVPGHSRLFSLNEAVQAWGCMRIYQTEF